MERLYLLKCYQVNSAIGVPTLILMYYVSVFETFLFCIRRH